MAVKAAPLQSPGEPLAGSHLRQAAQEVNQRSKKDEGHKVPPKPATSHTRLLRCALTLSALPPPHLPPTDPTNSHLLGGCAALCTATSALPPPLLPYPAPTLPAGVRRIVHCDVCIATTPPALPPSHPTCWGALHCAPRRLHCRHHSCRATAGPPAICSVPCPPPE